jgi:allantoicase
MSQDQLERLRTDYIDLAQPRLGAEVVFATDDFFADKDRLIDPAEPVFIPGKYDDNGKWMDGWESRRKRVAGYDWAVVKLGRRGMIAGFEIDTRHFTGNYPPFASIDACRCDDRMPPDNTEWVTIVPRLELDGNDRRLVAAEAMGPFTHVRLNIYPDGGVARLRVFGRIDVDWSKVDPDVPIDLLAMENGGRGVFANDEHFGKVENMTAPGRGKDMGDGWETRRRREPGHDWAIVELGHAGVISEITVDTCHFKGNYPDRCFIQAAPDARGAPFEISAQSEGWPVILPEQKLSADHIHTFKAEIAAHEPVRFVRLNIIPDGGVSRLRLVGKIAR